MNSNVVKVSDETMLKCLTYAIEYYTRMEQFQTKKYEGEQEDNRRILQAAYGKMAEEAVSEFLGVPSPEYLLFDVDGYSARPDIQSGSVNIHVKSCGYDRLDWLADSKTDNIVKSPLPNDLLILTRYRSDIGDGFVEICAAVEAKDLDGYWQAPQARWAVARGKKALYMNVLEEDRPQSFVRFQ